MFEIGGINLPNPENGDTYSADLNRSVNTTREGMVFMYKGTRPTFYTYTWTFFPVSKTVADSFRAMCIAQAGVPVDVVAEVLSRSCATNDYTPSTPQAVSGYIVGDPVITVERDMCSYSITMQFACSTVDTVNNIKYLVEA